jgi:small-conductance mechanosensitive channel
MMDADMLPISAFQSFLGHQWRQLVIPVCVLAATLAAGYAARLVLLRVLGGWQARSKSQTPRIVSQALAGPFMIWVLILGTHLAVRSSGLPPRATVWVGRVLLVLWFWSLTVVASRLAGDLIRLHGAGAAGSLPVTTLTQTLAQLAVVLLGLLVLLNQLGISITPMLTALGVGGLAVALALQDTLSNLFAGFYIAVAGQVRLGDYIRLNTGEEGYVTDITWRSTIIRALANNLIIIPNHKLGQAVVTNFHLPEKRLAFSITVSVAPDSEPERVERMLLEELQRAAGELPGMLAEPAPQVMFDPGLGDWALSFTLNYQVREFVDQFAVRAELRKRVLRRLRAEGIELPFPTRTVYVRQQEA